jgi:hypothetical protein
MRSVGDEVLIWGVERRGGERENGDGGHFSFFTFVFTLITFIGGVLLPNNEGSRLLGGGDLGVVGVGGELGEPFRERSKLALTNKLSIIVFHSLIDAIRNKVTLVAAIVARTSLLFLPWALEGESSRIMR